MTVGFLTGQDAQVAAWIGDQVHIHDFGACVAFGFVENGELLGGVLFNNYRPPNIEATIATVSPRWCTSSILRGIFSYPFTQLRCTRLTAITEVMNQPVRAFLCRLGFQEEGTLRKAFPDGIDAVIHGMLAEECRWITAEERMDRAA